MRFTATVVHRRLRNGPWRNFTSTWACAVAALVLAATSHATQGRIARADDAPPLVHYRISTHVAAAQREFDRGLGLMYAFDPEEALGHFQAAGRLDPTLAMAFWGIALGAGPNVNVPYDLVRARVGRAACAQAALLGRSATPEERDLIAALTVRYAVRSEADVGAAQAAYARAMDALATRYRSDVNVAALAAESYMDLTPLHMWRHDGSPERYTLRTIALLDGALARDPGHVGANHFLIHAYEHAPHPERALAAARRLAALALTPEDEHLAHMPEHIFLRLGMDAEAAAVGERATRLFRALLRNDHAREHDGYFHHDLQVLGVAYAMAGRWIDARAIATEVAAQVDDNEAAVETYARFGHYRELLALAAPARPGVRWHFARGLAANATGDRASAARESAVLHGATGTDARLTIARDVLDASIANHTGQRDRAIALLRDAVAAQDSLDLAEPPRWYAPVREALGARLYEARRYTDARHVFEDDLRRNPQNGRSLFGLATTLDALHDRAAAAVRARFRSAWRAADTTLAMRSL